LAVPMGLTTRVSAPGGTLAEHLTALVHGRVEVAVVGPEPAPVDEVAETEVDDSPADSPADSRAEYPTEYPAEYPADHVGEDPSWAPGLETLPAADSEFAVPVVLPRSVQPESWPAAPGTSGMTAVVEQAEDQAGGQAEVAAEVEDQVADRPARRSLRSGIGTIVSRIARGRSHDVDRGMLADEHHGDDKDDEDLAADEAAPDADVVIVDDPPTAPVPEPVRPAARVTSPIHRGPGRALRAQVTRDTPATVLGNAALLPDVDGRSRGSALPEGSELRRIDADDLDRHLGDHLGNHPGNERGQDRRVRPISRLGDPVEALVIDDYVTEPAYDPVIGPELAAARTRVGLSVDELAERTRIRPHVIESIEVDDFTPCGGDFYARGHLRTLARVLGREPEPLLAQFDERYATAPINARRVFEAELATGMTGSMRSTVGGPNWALLIGVVLALVMTWGVVRLFAAQPPELLQPTTPSLNGSAGVVGGTASHGVPAAVPKPLKVTLLGAHDTSQVVVRDRNGKVVWAGRVVLGERRTVQAVPPAQVQAQNAGAIDVSVNGTDRGTLGGIGQPGHRTFTRVAH
jgi:cytoskeletal protein RodZ